MLKSPVIKNKQASSKQAFSACTNCTDWSSASGHTTREPELKKKRLNNSEQLQEL